LKYLVKYVILNNDLEKHVNNFKYSIYFMWKAKLISKEVLKVLKTNKQGM